MRKLDLLCTALFVWLLTALPWSVLYAQTPPEPPTPLEQLTATFQPVMTNIGLYTAMIVLVGLALVVATVVVRMLSRMRMT